MPEGLGLRSDAQSTSWASWPSRPASSRSTRSRTAWLRYYGKTKAIVEGRPRKPVREYLLKQGRFAHFTEEDLAYFQAKVDEMWDKWEIPGVVPFRRVDASRAAVDANVGPPSRPAVVARRAGRGTPPGPPWLYRPFARSRRAQTMRHQRLVSALTLRWPRDRSAGRAAGPAWEPTKPIEFVIPAGTGGGADQMARLIAGIAEKHKLSPRPLIVVNKSGGAGAEGFLHVKGKKGDAHTIIITLSNLFTTPLHTGVPFSWKDLTPVARLALDEFILWVNAETPYKTAKEYLAAVEGARIGRAAREDGRHRLRAGGPDHHDPARAGPRGPSSPTCRSRAAARSA